MKWLADENFPHVYFRLLESARFDIKHIGIAEPGAEDQSVMGRAILEERIILTFDSDFGELVFKDGFLPKGVIFFRLMDYASNEPATILLQLLEAQYPIDSFFTIIDTNNVRQKAIAP